MTRPSVLLVLLLALPTMASAQLDLTARWGFSGHGAHASTTEGDSPAFRPVSSGNQAFVLGVSRGPWRAQAGIRRSEADLTLTGTESGVLTPSAITSWSGSLEFGRHILGGIGQPTLTMLGLVTRTRWSLISLEDDRYRWGAGVALEGSLDLRNNLRGVLRTDLELSGSLFDETELPSNYTIDTPRRTSLSLGLRFIPAGS